MRTFVKIFVDKDKLNEMLRLRREGWTYEGLAIIYGVDHSSIYKWCKIKRIHKPVQKLSLNFSDLLIDLGITEKPAKTYKDYLLEEKRRKFPNLYRVMA